jgi:uncharacterized membrane protein (DUF4010 family)
MDPSVDLSTVRATGGLRTFILFSQVGTIAGWMSQVANVPWLLVAGLVVVAIPVVAGYILVIAALTNTLVKSGMVVMLAAPPLKPPVLVASAAILATGLGIIFLSPLL